jgi:hypothetical protein
VIYYHSDMMLCPNQIEPPFCKSSNDNEKLLVIDGVVDFWSSELAWVIRQRVKHTDLIWLGEDCLDGELGSIRLDVERLSWVGMKKHQGSFNGLFQQVECRLCLCFPFKWSLLAGKSNERLCNHWKPFDEAPIKIGETEKWLYLSYLSWNGPLSNSLNLPRVHCNYMWWDNVKNSCCYSLSNSRHMVGRWYKIEERKGRRRRTCGAAKNPCLD